MGTALRIFKAEVGGLEEDRPEQTTTTTTTKATRRTIWGPGGVPNVRPWMPAIRPSVESLRLLTSAEVPHLDATHGLKSVSVVVKFLNLDSLRP